MGDSEFDRITDCDKAIAKCSSDSMSLLKRLFVAAVNGEGNAAKEGEVASADRVFISSKVIRLFGDEPSNGVEGAVEALPV